MIRMWSMTKVLTCFTALRLYEEGLLKLQDPVSDYIPSFDRVWRVVRCPVSAPAQPLWPLTLCCGWGPRCSRRRRSSRGASRSTTTRSSRARRRPCTTPPHPPPTPCSSSILCRRRACPSHPPAPHCQKAPPRQQAVPAAALIPGARSSGIEYDQFSEHDERSGGALGCGMGGAIANALRQKINPDVYRSTNILGELRNPSTTKDSCLASGLRLPKKTPAIIFASRRGSVARGVL